jgi:hypothetical protein
MVVSLEAAVAVLLLALIWGEFLIYSPPVESLQRNIEVRVQALTFAQDTSTLQVSISADYRPQSIRFAAFPLLTSNIRQPNVFVFNDAQFPTAGVVATAVQGVFDHLAGELETREYSGTVNAITAPELAQVLSATNQASGRAIVLMTGVLPANVFSRKVDLLSPWVKAGGLVVWGGGTIGYYSCEQGQSLAASASLSYGEKGAQLLLGSGVATFPFIVQRTADTPSVFANALGINYRLTSAGIVRNKAIARGGLALGWLSGAYSSITYLPAGHGGYLLFGGEILDEGAVAQDLAQILLSSATAAFGPVTSTQVNLSRDQATASFNWSLPFVPGPAGIMVAAFDPDPNGVVFVRRVIAQ